MSKCAQQDLSSGGAPQGSLLGENYSHQASQSLRHMLLFSSCWDKEKFCAAREEKMLGSL